MISGILLVVGVVVVIVAILDLLGAIAIGAAWWLILLVGVVCLLVGWWLRSGRRSPTV